MRANICDYQGCKKIIAGPVQWTVGLGGVDAEGTMAFRNIDACNSHHLELAFNDAIDVMRGTKRAGTDG